MILPDGDTHFRPEHWDTYQREIYDLALKFCPSRRHAIDCGAHVGIQAHRLAEDFDHLSAFEPCWGHQLQANMQGYTNWQFYPCGLSNREGRLHLEVNRENSGRTQVVEVATAHTIDVYSRTLDSYGFKDVDFIKIDVEGHELALLEGSAQTLAENKPTLLLELERHSPQKTQVETLLKSWGYTQQHRKNADTIWTISG